MLGADLPDLGHDPESVRDTADEILTGADYGDAEPGPIERFFEWLFERIADLLERLFGNWNLPVFGGGEGGSSVVGFLLLVVLGAVLIGFLWWFWRHRVERVKEGEDDDTEVVSRPRLSSTQWRDEAARLESEGQWREAIRAEYRALVATLVEPELLTEVPGKTAGEFRAEVRAELPSLAPDFSDATDLFSGIWYAPGEAGPAELAAIRDLESRILTRSRELEVAES